MTIQRVRRLRRRLLLKCKSHIRIDDVGPFTNILDALRLLRDSVVPDKCPDGRRDASVILRSLLTGLYEKMETHAKKKAPGIASIVSNELSGHAGVPMFRRVDASCLQYEKAVLKPVVAEQGRGFRGPPADRPPSFNRGFNRGFKAKESGPKELSEVICYGCFKAGHYRDRCPNPAAAPQPKAT